MLIVQSNLGIGGAQKSLISLLNVIDYSKFSVDLLLFGKGAMYEDVNPNVNIIDLQREDLIYFIPINKLLKAFGQINSLSAIYSRIKVHLINKFNRDKYSEQVLWEAISHKIDKVDKKYDVAIAYCQGLPTYYVAEKVESDKKIAWMHSDLSKQKHDLDYSERVYKRFDLINCVSEKAKDQFIKILPSLADRMGVFYNIISISDIRKAAEDISVFKTIPKCNDEQIRITTVGRLVKPKGYDLAIEAAKKLRDRGYKFQWIFVGDGRLRNMLQHQVKEAHLEDNVVFAGTQSNPYPFVEKADMYVQSSRWEGYCITLAEAKALCKPIVTTNFAGADEQVTDGETGLVVDIDSEAIADGIEKLISKPLMGYGFTKKLEQLTTEKNYSEEFRAMLASLE